MNPLSKLLAYAALLLMPLPLLKADDITVFAAASLTDALKEIGTNYEKTSGDKVAFNFAASNTLEMQIKAGAPADLFFSADEAKMNDMEKQNLIVKETRTDLLSNTLVIVVPTENTPNEGAPVLVSAKALAANPAFKKIALGQPESVPAGIYAEEYLKKIGIWDQISAKVIPCESVRAALAAVETGNADAGIVYKTDALHSKKVKIAYEVPAAEGPAITYPIAQVQGSKHASAAAKFLAYLSTPASQAIFKQYGFITK